MKHAAWIICFAACCLAIGAAQSPQDPAAGQQAGKTQPAKNIAGSQQNVGELKFYQNCNRCHTAPQELSPRISGTVVLHMRMRASLSDADAKAILQYLAP